jgi:phenylpropionate dioxygenase-like ring-hydroxylating dioxygenase large terminal subunit
MIPNQWYAILESNEIKAGKPVGVTRMGEKLVLWRDKAGKLGCLVDSCPHRGAALSIGKLMNGCVQCPFHGFEFDSTGSCKIIPANGKNAAVPKAFHAKNYTVEEAFGFVWIWWGEPQKDLPPIKLFDSIGPGMSYSTLRKHWKTHYSRAIENQLDVVHLPFVHATTIGRGGRTVIDGPVHRMVSDVRDCDLLNMWVFNRADDGTPPRRPRDMEVPDRNPSIQFRFPNTWHNWISSDMRIVAAFAPIDGENTMMYVRMYQRVINIPVLKQLMLKAGRWSNAYILQQDQHVVETQLPKRSGLKIGEQLIQGDGPIIDYRRQREMLILQAAGSLPEAQNQQQES